MRQQSCAPDAERRSVPGYAAISGALDNPYGRSTSGRTRRRRPLCGRSRPAMKPCPPWWSVTRPWSIRRPRRSSTRCEPTQAPEFARRDRRGRRDPAGLGHLVGCPAGVGRGGGRVVPAGHRASDHDLPLRPAAGGRGLVGDPAVVCRCARTAAATAAGGAVVAVAATTLLAARHTLAGPTMVRSGSALAETLIAISAGVVVDAVLAVLGTRSSARS